MRSLILFFYKKLIALQESKTFGNHSGEEIFSLIMVRSTARELLYISKKNLIMKLRYSERTSKGDLLS